MFTVYQMSYILNMPDTVIRRWLREEYPTRAPGKGGRWQITTAMARRLVVRWTREST